jgi:hypothetical protein
MEAKNHFTFPGDRFFLPDLSVALVVRFVVGLDAPLRTIFVFLPPTLAVPTLSPLGFVSTVLVAVDFLPCTVSFIPVS